MKNNSTKIPTYLKKLIKLYPNIKSGRKNFSYHHQRILKTLKILKKYSEQCILYKGLFTENANRLESNLKDRSVAIVNIDCDIYTSTVDSVEIIENFLQIGSIILFDDYNCFNADNSKGQRKALREFKSKTNWTIEPFFTYMFSGQSFLVVGKKNL